MKAQDHHAQDALERKAAAILASITERRGLLHHTAPRPAALYSDYLAHLAARRLTEQIVATQYRIYGDNLDTYLPLFLNELTASHPTSTFSFIHMATQGRLALSKADILIVIHHDNGETTRIPLSLKNYRTNITRIQVGSGTYQSWLLAFYLDRASVGSWHHPSNGSRMSSQNKQFGTWRDAALTLGGNDKAVPLFRQLDTLNTSMRRKFLDDEQHRHYQPDTVDAERKNTGTAGAAIAKQLLDLADPTRVRTRLLEAIGFDGTDEILIMGPDGWAHTLTDTAFRRFVHAIRNADLTYRTAGQTLTLQLTGTSNLTIAVPFTINTNGAWYRDGEPYEGARWHAKEARNLTWGERRPKKSREIATSINTYLDLNGTGVLIDR